MGSRILAEIGKYLLRTYGGEFYNVVKAVRGAKKLRKYSKYAKWLKRSNNKHYALFKKRLRKRYIKYILSHIGVRILKSIPLGRDIYEIITKGLYFYAKKLAYTQLVPLEIRQIIYLIHLAKRITKKPKRKKIINTKKIHKDIIEVKKNPTLAKDLFYNPDQPENIVNLTKYKPRNDAEKKIIDEILNVFVFFGVKSPERHCFDKAPQAINIKRRQYSVPIAGEIFSKPFKIYTYQPHTQQRTAYYYSKAVSTNNYGREVFKYIRPKALDYATRKELFKLYNK